MAKSKGREWISLECEKCGTRNYRTPGLRQGKLQLKKFCRICRAHNVHKEKKR